jgi:hypothetical protein
MDISNASRRRRRRDAWSCALVAKRPSEKRARDAPEAPAASRMPAPW